MYPYSAFGGFPVGSFKEPVAIPAHQPEDGEQVVAKFGKDWLPLVLGSCQQLLLQSTWDTTDHDALLDVQAQAFDLIALIGSAIDMSAIVDVRLDPTNPCNLQKTYDGTTWVDWGDLSLCAVQTIKNEIANGTLVAGGAYDSTQGHADAPWPSGSVPSGQTAQCLSATNIVSIWSSAWTQVRAGFEAGQAAIIAVETVTGILSAFVTVVPAVFEFLAIMNGLFEGGTTALDDLLSTATLTDLTCALVNHLSADGSCDAIQFSAIRADALAGASGLTASTLGFWLDTLGPVGITRSGKAAGIMSGDCGVCGWQNCWLNGKGLGSIVTPVMLEGHSAGSYNSGTDAIDSTPISSISRWANAQIPINTPSEITDIYVDIQFALGTGSNSTDIAIDGTVVQNFPIPGHGGIQHCHWHGSVTGSVAVEIVAAADIGDTMSIVRIEVSGPVTDAFTGQPDCS